MLNFAQSFSRNHLLRRAQAALKQPRWQLMVYIEICALVLIGLALLPGGFDYLHYFHPLARGCVACTYNPYFTEWFMRPVGLIEDWRTAYLVWCALCMVVLYPSARALGGSPFVALASPTFIWILWLGQIDPIATTGLALAWWSLNKKRPLLLGVALVLLATKPQMAAFAILALALWGGWRAWLVPIGAALLSFVIYGPDWIQRWLGYTPQTMMDGQAWFYISAIWLLVGLLGVFVIRGRAAQLQYIVAATLAGAPYLGAYSFFAITLFRLRWWEVAVSYLPFATIGLTGDDWWLGLLLLQPLLVLARLLREHGTLALPSPTRAQAHN